ncbi:unnamed protein product [Brugia timori]|uniref:Brix domain-containing protein n=1 Tax=Brugia timori TaxID=42155 RepID=A0A0R3QX09_9BILA|nr:unnamed protein product [Brugia timori]
MITANSFLLYKNFFATNGWLLDELFNRCSFPAVVEYIKGQTIIFQIENDDIAITDQSSSLRLFSYNYVPNIIKRSNCHFISTQKAHTKSLEFKIERTKLNTDACIPFNYQNLFVAHEIHQKNGNIVIVKMLLHKKIQMKLQKYTLLKKIGKGKNETDKEKERLKKMEEKRIEERKPKIMKRSAKEERIAKGKVTRGKGDYSTMDDVLSDWDSERDGKKKNEDDGQKSRANTNLEDVRRKKLIAEGKAVVEVQQNMLQKAVQKTPNDHLIALKRWIKQLVVRRNDDVPLFIGFTFPCIFLKPTYLLAERWKICKLQKFNPSSTIISDKYVSIRRQDRAVIKFITSFELQTRGLVESKLEAH